MSSSWNLTARLIAKHFTALGDKVAGAIASFDPETATEADRDQLAKVLQETATKLAIARKDFQKEQDDVDQLKKLLENDEKALAVLANKLQSGEIDEATVTLFCDEFENNKNRLPQEEQEAAQAKAFMDELQAIVDGFSKQLADFDAVAKKAAQQLAAAKANIQTQEFRKTQIEQLTGLRNGAQGASTALSALTRKASELQAQADGMKIVNDIGQKPLDQAKKIDEIRKVAASAATATETPLERMQRLMAKSPEAA